MYLHDGKLPQRFNNSFQGKSKEDEQNEVHHAPSNDDTKWYKMRINKWEFPHQIQTMKKKKLEEKGVIELE